jgi:flagellar hook-associated protein 2
MAVTRDSNAITDVIDGVTLNLMSTASSDVTVTINNDRSTLKTNLQNMVTAYNDLLLLFDNFTAVDSEADMAGALSEDGSMVRFLTDKIRSIVFADSSTPSDSVVAMRDLGVTMNRYGKIEFSESVYDAKVASSYSDIVTMLTADTINQNLFETSAKGLAQDIVTALEDMTDATGVVTNRETNATAELAKYEEQLIKLQTRMDAVYDRYLMQFGAMETLMATLDNTKDYLTSQLESLSKVYEVD